MIIALLLLSSSQLLSRSCVYMRYRLWSTMIVLPVFLKLLDSSATYSYNKDLKDSQVMDILHQIPLVSLRCDELEPLGNNILYCKNNDRNTSVYVACYFLKRYRSLDVFASLYQDMYKKVRGEE